MPVPHEKLVAWQRADDLFIELHRLVKRSFPRDERYELSSQLRRAAYSVAANIVEGMSRRSPREKVHFLNVAVASLAETGYCLHAARRLGYVTEVEYEDLLERVKMVGGPLKGLHDQSRRPAVMRDPRGLASSAYPTKPLPARLPAYLPTSRAERANPL